MYHAVGALNIGDDHAGRGRAIAGTLHGQGTVGKRTEAQAAAAERGQGGVGRQLGGELRKLPALGAGHHVVEQHCLKSSLGVGQLFQVGGGIQLNAKLLVEVLEAWSVGAKTVSCGLPADRAPSNPQ